MSTANPTQHEAWNGDSGTRWAATADRRDRMLAPVADALLETAALRAGESVIDVGCGCGVTTLAAATAVGPDGAVTGIDLSAPMLTVARHRAEKAGITNATFREADAQIEPPDPGAAQVAISRFGTMFFADPTAAFTNLAGGLAAGGRLCIATWQPLLANEWLIVPGAILLRHTDLPAEADPGAPGMFAQSEPATIATVLTNAGFTDIVTTPHDVTFTLGANIDEAVDHLTEGGPGQALLDTITDDAVRQQAVAEVRAELAGRLDADGVRLRGAIFLTTASRT